MSTEEEAVQVAVRMRPFNGRETDAKSTRIIRMESLEKGSKTFITNPATGQEKLFEYDHSFQTFSEHCPEAGPYASQETVFETLGRPVMASALEGRNVCLFAYGQTGSGKSYSMLGKPDQPGIIPRACSAIFEQIAKEKDASHEHTVDIQVVEIYCEQINDLLADRKTWPDHGHKPRFTPQGYVVDSVSKPCSKYAEILEAFQFADGNRSVGSHALNPESSRAHTIYTINYERKTRHETGKVVETVLSRINLVDLAGSERTDLAGTSGQMQKEGNLINLSLSSLGRCIMALSKGTLPNFSESKLTLLLKGSMTNGRVIMIAALSPASLCYDESMSTLRFAERIKKVKIKVSKNVVLDPVADIKKAMEEMRVAMQAEIEGLQQRQRAAGQGDPKGAERLRDLLREQQEDMETMRQTYERRMKALSESAGDRAKRAEAIRTMQSQALGGAMLCAAEQVREPHLRNLHEDPRLAGTLVYPLRAGLTLVGRSTSEPKPHLAFNGMGIVKGHAEIKWAGGQVVVTPSLAGRTLVNGKPITQPTELRHNYRLWLGNNYAFRFVFPGKEVLGDPQFGAGGPDYGFAEQEIAQHASLEGNQLLAQRLPPNVLRLLSDALKKVEQANIAAKDLGQNTEFEVKMFKNRLSGETDVAVLVTNSRGSRVWPWQKFEAKLAEFTTEWQRWSLTDSAAGQRERRYRPPKGSADPFADTDPYLIGEADVWLQSLANLMEFECDAPVISLLSKTEGRINVALLPCDRNGGTGPWEDDDPLDPFVEEPEELLGTTIRFRIRIVDVIFNTGLEKATVTRRSCRYSHVWCRYKWAVGDPEERWVVTPVAEEITFNPKFGFEQEHQLMVTPEVLARLKGGQVIVQVWGHIVEQDEAVDEEDPKLDAEIAEKRALLATLEKQVKERRRLLAALM